VNANTPKPPRHPGQADRRDSLKWRIKTDPDRAKENTELRHRR
jgi:hypothetical protein